MRNLYSEIKRGIHFKKIELDSLLFVEYTCPIMEKSQPVWSETDYIVHVLSGKKVWKTNNQYIEATKGDTVYIKKGAYIIEQYFEEDFCMYGFFVNDDFITETIRSLNINNQSEVNSNDSIIVLDNNMVLAGYLNSIFPYFNAEGRPTDALMQLKFKELLLALISSQSDNELPGYLLSFSDNSDDLKYIMERNFTYNLSLNEFAELTHRSLSKFKRDFYATFGKSPGRWLVDKRLSLAADLIRTTDQNISRIAYDVGFKDTSHFSNAFKSKYGVTCKDYRQLTPAYNQIEI